MSCGRPYILLVLHILLTLDCAASSAQSIGWAKRSLPDGTPVEFREVPVTAAFPGSVYVQHVGGQGIRVETEKTFEEGEVVNVRGTIRTDPLNDERYIAAEPEFPEAMGSTLIVRPVGLAGRMFGGGDFGLQRGIPGDPNLNTMGMLVTVWGSVLGFDRPTGGSWLKLSDTGSQGQEITVIVPSDVKLDPDWDYISATGICTVEKSDGGLKRVLKARRTSDIICLRSWAESRVKMMTLDEKIGQLFHIRVDGDVFTESMRQAIQEKHIGGIIYFQYNGNLNDPVRSARLSNDLQACAMRPDGRGIPLLLSMDQEGGRVIRITGGTDFPGNMGLGASRSAGTAYQVGDVLGREVRAVGANMDLAPVLDVNNNPENPVIGVRSFGERPELVAEMGIAYMEGLHSAGVIATGKHFPGHGDTSVDSHTGLPIVTYDFETLDNVHGRPFREAIRRGLDAVMTAHIVVTCLDPDRPATLSPQVIDGYLRDNLGFDGVVMTDSMGMAGITSGYTVEQATVMAIRAGVDVILLPPDLDRAIAAVRAALQSGEITEARIDESVIRILRLKRRYGLFANPYVDSEAADDIVGNPEHRTVELAAARAAMTLVQNKDGFLPLNLAPEEKLLLVTVQSSSETTSDAAARFASYISQKHSNLQSMAISANPNSSQRNAVKNAAASAQAVIVGTSRSQLSANAGQAILIRELLSMGKPVVAVGLREPYELAGFAEVNAYIAAYNYRDCGFQAAADVIFGEVNPTGLLPVTIPGLYLFGHGLSY